MRPRSLSHARVQHAAPTVRRSKGVALLRRNRIGANAKGGKTDKEARHTDPIHVLSLLFAGAKSKGESCLIQDEPEAGTGF